MGASALLQAKLGHTSDPILTPCFSESPFLLNPEVYGEEVTLGLPVGHHCGLRASGLLDAAGRKGTPPHTHTFSPGLVLVLLAPLRPHPLVCPRSGVLDSSSLDRPSWMKLAQVALVSGALCSAASQAGRGQAHFQHQLMFG